jgi:hypothetical protein
VSHRIPDYSARAAHYDIEIGAVPLPRSLPGLLQRCSGGTVGEVPSGCGHFLSAYAASSCAVTFVDACTAQLVKVRQRATAIGIGDRVHAVEARVEKLAEAVRPLDVMVVPNASLNQLAAQGPVAELLAAYHATITRGGWAVFQMLCSHPSGRVDAAAFYDPRLPDSTWVDEWCRPTDRGSLVRRRRQVHAGTRLHISFELYHDDGPPILSEAELEILALCPLLRLMASLGLDVHTVEHALDGMTEITAMAVERRARGATGTPRR